MSGKVFANGREVTSEGSDTKVVAAFPDVCLSPPPPPAGPIPVPYPNSSFSKDLKEGSSTVTAKGKPIGLYGKSYFKTSPLGDEAATRSFGANVITHGISGKTSFAASSMDVLVEGKNVTRHLDLTTSNHSSDPPGVPTPMPGLSTMTPRAQDQVHRLFRDQTGREAGHRRGLDQITEDVLHEVQNQAGYGRWSSRSEGRWRMSHGSRQPHARSAGLRRHRSSTLGHAATRDWVSSAVSGNHLGATVSDLEHPSFLDGTFLFDEDGYRHSSPPPLDLLSPAALASDDPWIVLAAALEHAKNGEHQYVPLPLERLHRDSAPSLILAVTTLVGDAGSQKDVEGLLPLMGTDQDDYTRVVACRAAAHSGYLWMAEKILDCWKTIRLRERDSVLMSLRLILQRQAADISDSSRFDEDIGYIEFVNERINALHSQYGDAVLWYAAPLSATRLVEQMFEVIRGNSLGDASAMLGPYRHRLEAMTGVDCSRFYDRKKDVLRPLAVQATLEELVATGTLQTIPIGKRWFHGHAVP